MMKHDEESIATHYCEYRDDRLQCEELWRCYIGLADGFPLNVGVFIRRTRAVMQKRTSDHSENVACWRSRLADCPNRSRVRGAASCTMRFEMRPRLGPDLRLAQADLGFPRGYQARPLGMLYLLSLSSILGEACRCLGMLKSISTVSHCILSLSWHGWPCAYIKIRNAVLPRAIPPHHLSRLPLLSIDRAFARSQWAWLLAVPSPPLAYAPGRRTTSWNPSRISSLFSPGAPSISGRCHYFHLNL